MVSGHISQDNLEKLENLLAAGVAEYQDNLPIHLSNPQESCIVVLTEEEYAGMSDRQIQNLLRNKNLLISESQVAPMKFDEDGLRTVAPLYTKIEIQGTVHRLLCEPPVLTAAFDQSIQVNDDENAEGHLVDGTLQQLLDAARSPNGEILNALELPMSRAPLDPIPRFSSDLIAWEATQGYIKSDTGIPMADIRWGEAATAGACTLFHIESNGFGKEIRLKCGKKICIFIQDRNGDFNVINAFNKFELDGAGHYKIEVVLLMPGTRLCVL